MITWQIIVNHHHKFVYLVSLVILVKIIKKVLLVFLILIVIVSYYFSSKYLTEYQKVSDYAYGQNGLKQNYHKSMQQKQKLQLLEKSPMYALIPEVELDANLMTLVNKYNGKFQNEVLEIENKFIKSLYPYNQWLGRKLKEDPTASLTNAPMSNGHGSSHQNYCALDDQNILLYLLNLYPPSDNIKVIDIGSGWGDCSKQLALLGYKVYSVDIDQSHLDYQKHHFCDTVSKNSFIYQYWRNNFPEMLDTNYFKSYCKKIRKNNIEFIDGDFSEKSTIAKISDKTWDVVLSLNNLQFMNSQQQANLFKIVDNYLIENGIFIITAKTKLLYESSNLDSKDIYDIDLKNEVFNKKTFVNYKILSVFYHPSIGYLLGVNLYKHQAKDKSKSL